MLLIQHHRRWITTYQFYERGHLPHAGGWAQQDAQTVEILRTMDDVIGATRRDLIERQRAENGN